ncbi:MAG: hypothetical protein HYV39_02065 [Candidatus Levybacteria bacterium]|nr:hypothetical protein [Candidatus Levybacteria bacterium]
MNNISISASDLKKHISDVLNDVYFHKKVAVIERYGKPIAEIVPIEKGETKSSNIQKALDATFGILPDFPDVTKYRRSRKKKFVLSL